MRRYLKGHSTIGAVWVQAVLVLVVPKALAGQTQYSSYKLTENWETDLGPTDLGTADQAAFYRLAACPDGYAYLTDALGRVAVLNSSGAVLSDSRHYSELVNSLAIACDERGRLISVSARLLAILERSGSYLELVSAVARKWRPGVRKIALAGENLLLAVGTSDGKSFIHAMDLQGTVLASFGEASVQWPPKLGYQGTVRGTPVWNRAKQQLLFLPVNPFEIRVYDARGNLLDRKQQIDSTFKPMRYDMLLDAGAPGDEVMYAALLPGGELAVQTYKTQQNNPNRRRLYMNVLDKELRLVSSWPQGFRFGVLQGASADGTLYFARIDPTGIHIVSARLSPSQP